VLDTTTWTYADPIKVEHAACLFAEIDPALYQRFDIHKTNHSLVEPWVQALSGAFASGEFPPDPNNALEMIGDYRGSRVSRENLRAFAEKRQLRPRFLFHSANPPDRGAETQAPSKADGVKAAFLKLLRESAAPRPLPEAAIRASFAAAHEARPLTDPTDEARAQVAALREPKDTRPAKVIGPEGKKALKAWAQNFPANNDGKPATRDDAERWAMDKGYERTSVRNAFTELGRTHPDLRYKPGKKKDNG
jgi:hypothetical protein